MHPGLQGWASLVSSAFAAAAFLLLLLTPVLRPSSAGCWGAHRDPELLLACWWAECVWSWWLRGGQDMPPGGLCQTSTGSELGTPLSFINLVVTLTLLQRYPFFVEKEWPQCWAVPAGTWQPPLTFTPRPPPALWSLHPHPSSDYFQNFVLVLLPLSLDGILPLFVPFVHLYLPFFFQEFLKFLIPWDQSSLANTVYKGKNYIYRDLKWKEQAEALLRVLSWSKLWSRVQHFPV